jgi:hypothetical protein
LPRSDQYSVADDNLTYPRSGERWLYLCVAVDGC